MTLPSGAKVTHPGPGPGAVVRTPDSPTPGWKFLLGTLSPFPPPAPRVPVEACLSAVVYRPQETPSRLSVSGLFRHLRP